MTEQLCLTSRLGAMLVVLSAATAQDTKHGTAIAAIRTPLEIVVAADSRVVNSDETTDTQPLCKIRQVRDLFYAISGMSSDLATDFDAFRTLNNALQIEGGFLKRIENCEALVKPQLENTLERQRITKPQTFQKSFTNMSPLGVIFVGLETNTLFLYHRRFVINSSSNQTVLIGIERSVCPGTDCPAGIGTVFVGPRQDVQRFERENPDYWRSNLVASARKYVQMRIDAKAVSVGPPIDIIRITALGAEWIQRKNECPAIQR